MKHGKKYQEALKKYDKQQRYPYDKAIELVKDLAYAKFDETVELHMRLNLKKSQTVRDTVVLPHQFSDEKKILVFAKGEKADEAKEAGATHVGDSDLVAKIQEGWLDFDIAVATPDMMSEVGRLGQILGRRGLMPNPKARTVTMDIAAAIAELKRGRTEFRTDKSNIVHCAVGKVSMEDGQIVDNIKIIVDEVIKRKPSDVKGFFIESIAVSSTMGPGVYIDEKQDKSNG